MAFNAGSSGAKTFLHLQFKNAMHVCGGYEEGKQIRSVKKLPFLTFVICSNLNFKVSAATQIDMKVVKNAHNFNLINVCTGPTTMHFFSNFLLWCN